MRCLVLLFAAFAVSACGSVQTEQRKPLFDGDEPPIARSGGAGKGEPKPPASEFLSDDYADEWKLIYAGQGDIKRPPEFGLALSGGGTRAASYSIGVLQALHEHGLMDRFDVLSTVSGGSYAGLWYFSQNYHMQKMQQKYPVYGYARDDLFVSPPYSVDGDVTDEAQDCQLRDLKQYRFQRHVEDRSDILARSVYPPLQWMDYGLKFATFIPSMFLSTFTELIFNWDLNVNPVRRYYENGLERTYGLVPMQKIAKPCKDDGSPDGNDRKFINDKSILAFPRAHATDIKFPALKEWTQHTRASYVAGNTPRPGANFPFWIINTTAELETEERVSVEAAPASDEASGAGAASDDGKNPGAEDEVEVAAFVPPRTAKALHDPASDLANVVYEFTPLEYGSNYYGIIDGDPDISVSRAVSISGAAVDRNGVGEIWGSMLNFLNVDIGYNVRNHSDSVTPTSRLLQRVLPFPFYRWVDFKHDKRHHSVHLGDGGQSENLGAYALIRRGVKHILIVDAEHDPGAEFSALRRLARRLDRFDGLQMKLDQPIPLSFDPLDAEDAIFTGTVTGFPFADEDGSDYVVKFTYLKLAVDRSNLLEVPCDPGAGYYDLAHEYACGIQRYMQQHKSRHSFPHDSTVDVFYDREQVAAYRNLGYLRTISLDDCVVSSGLVCREPPP